MPFSYPDKPIRPAAALTRSSARLATPALLLLSACAAAPTGIAPPPGGLGALPASQSLAAAQAPAGTPAAQNPAGAPAAWPGEGWWQSYGDAQLPQLINEALAHSPDMAAAAARLAKANAMTGVARAALLPTLDGKATVGLTKQSYNMGIPPQYQFIIPHGWKPEGQITATLGWDIDLWGRNRAALSAARAEGLAAEIDSRATRLALATAIADSYVGLADDIATQGVRQATLTNREDVESLVTQRFQQGLENRAGVAMARADAASARADLAAAQAQVATRRNQLAALMGAGPDRGLAIAAPALAPVGDRGLPADVTSDLLGRRADIAAARARALAAAARVQVAHADFFPAITLQGLAGYQSLGLGQLLTPGSTFGTVGPALTLPIFHGGELRGLYRGARADYDLAVADYNRTVVGAYQQLADAVTTRAAAIRQRDNTAAAEAASADAYNLAGARFKAGLSTRLDVLASQDRLLAASAARSAADTAARQADVALIRALGGGYAAPATNKPYGAAAPQGLNP